MCSYHQATRHKLSAPVEVLETIVEAVAADVEVILDGGVRRGTDILVALALGAKAVSFARPFLYGLAAAGEAGARRAMEILSDELRRDMVLVGANRISDEAGSKANDDDDKSHGVATISKI